MCQHVKKLAVEKKNSGTAGPYKIVATTGMIGDIVYQVAGDRAEIDVLMGPGIDPHLYKPTRSDIARINEAQVIFYNGLLLEGKMTDALVRAATAGKKVYAVTELLDSEFLLEPPGFEGHADPHVWMDPRAWSKAVDVVAEKLAQYDPAKEKPYYENARRLKEEFESLDEYSEKVLDSVPAESRVLVTAHDAFNYFGQRYGFEVLGIQGISTESEAGVKDIEKIVDTLVNRQIAAVFVESTVSERNIRALLEGAAAQDHSVSIGATLFSDAMGAPGTYEGTYLGMIDHNVTRIAQALGGEAPEQGRLERLSTE